ncbi:hypothetical protein BJI49_12585 [Acetobacter pasteurianus]|uniref:hypothetical protein n=1 Tax=Acetobacter pasteurianus TaxID=438 RepID=UPI00024580F5|nr:hypothetical protein [Acetobacter pasteurianus]RCL04672.1 hypothetical protein BJI49_12585 [Acetobacter pasteurianus]GAB31510.1 hypothetical protein APS_2112 [Acetobacter pasteurianus subsp. pasteurianus LMG 1262 = NBRC 106471]GCD50360.1 hypothetical protein NBRC106471_1916 [Acetobacter pasteurianus subsp. pasteurianus LMG 1262 = NBRC 106471]
MRSLAKELALISLIAALVVLIMNGHSEEAVVHAGENTRLHQGMQADKRGALSETRYLGRA